MGQYSEFVGETLYYRDSSLQMKQFRALDHRLLDLAEALCRLMYDWEPAVDLDRIKDDLYNNRHRFSFVQHPATAYLTHTFSFCTVHAWPKKTVADW
jgi:hypothetical protein